MYASDQDGSWKTYSAFSNIQNGPNGIITLGDHWDATALRSAWIGDLAEARLFAYIRVMQSLGTGKAAWYLAGDCAGFAATAWKIATFERLRTTSLKTLNMIPDPSVLTASILRANGGKQYGYLQVKAYNPFQALRIGLIAATSPKNVSYGFEGRGGIVSAPTFGAALEGWFAQQAGMKMQGMNQPVSTAEQGSNLGGLGHLAAGAAP